MRLQPSEHISAVPFYVKCSGIALLMLSMVLIVSCGSDTSQNAPGTPVATITIRFGQFSGSPTPDLNGLYCGGWATNTTPPYSMNGIEYIYGKFTQTVQGNPVGVNNAAAVATILWPDGSTQVDNATTGSDGIAVFAIPLRPSAINHLVQIQITFSSGSQTCTIPSAAYFTAVVASPTATTTAMPSPTTTSTPSVTPTGSLTPVGTGIPTITPTVTRTPKPGH
jgi:hypothetical protein